MSMKPIIPAYLYTIAFLHAINVIASAPVTPPARAVTALSSPPPLVRPLRTEVATNCSADNDSDNETVPAEYTTKEDITRHRAIRNLTEELSALRTDQRTLNESKLNEENALALQILHDPRCSRHHKKQQNMMRKTQALLEITRTLFNTTQSAREDMKQLQRDIKYRRRRQAPNLKVLERYALPEVANLCILFDIKPKLSEKLVRWSIQKIESYETEPEIE